jgi:hypothetical protein
MMYSETYPELRARHKKELNELLAAHCDFTIMEASAVLNINRGTLRRLASYYGLNFHNHKYVSKTILPKKHAPKKITMLLSPWEWQK